MKASHRRAWSQLHKAARAPTLYHQTLHPPEEAEEAEAMVEVDEAADAVVKQAEDEEGPPPPGVLVPCSKGTPTDGLKGNVFQCHGKHNSDKQQFLKTVGVLDEYINKTFVYPQNMSSVCKTFEITSLIQPPNLPPETHQNDMGAKMIWEASMKNYMKRVNLLESNTIAIYAIVWGQCSPMMQSELGSLDSFKARSKVCDCIWLWKEIQCIIHRFKGTCNVSISLDVAWSAYCSQKQGTHQPLYEYLKEFQSCVQVLEHYGAAIGADGPNQVPVMAEMRERGHGLAEDHYTARAIIAAKPKSIAISFLKRADRERCGGLWSKLENQFTRGLDHYPEDIVGAYDLYLNYKPPPKQHQQRQHNEETDDVSALNFLQNAVPTPETNGITHPSIKGFNCNVKGHYVPMHDDPRLTRARARRIVVRVPI